MHKDLQVLRNRAVSRSKQRLAITHATEYRELLKEECHKLGISAPREHVSTTSNKELSDEIERLKRLLEHTRLTGKALECAFCGWDKVDDLTQGADLVYRCSVHICEVCRYEGYARENEKILCDTHAELSYKEDQYEKPKND